MTVNKKTTIGNYIFLAGIFVLFMLNLNVYEWYVSMSHVNYVVAAILMTVLFICNVDFKSLIKDKLFILLVVTNVMSAIFIILNKCINAAALTIYIFLMGLYLYDKIKFTIKQVVVFLLFVGAFFIYWTIDIKGYFKGYSINFGGIVLVVGFVCLITLLEMAKYCLVNINEESSTKSVLSFLAKYPYYITLIEAGLFLIGYKIIAYYQVRTGVMVLTLFALLLLIPKKLLYKGPVKVVLVVSSLLLVVVFPILYIYIAKSGIYEGVEVFYRPLIGSRFENYGALYGLIKSNLIKGIGSISVAEGTTFREGFVDCTNALLQVATVYGVIVAVLAFIMLGYVLIKQAGKIKNNPYLATLFISAIVLVCASASENLILNPIFSPVFFGVLFSTSGFLNSGEALTCVDIYAVYKKIFNKDFKAKFVPVFSITAMVLIMYLILGPLEIFYSNYVEFEFNTSEFIFFFLGISVAVTLVMALVLASMPSCVGNIYSAVLLGIGISSYIQYMFLNETLSDVLGKPDFGPSVGPKFYISVIVVILAIGLSVYLTLFKLKKYKNEIFIYLSLGLSVVMLIAVETIAIGLLREENKSDYSVVFDATDEYVMGRSENTVVIVVDTFGRDILDEVLAEHPDAIDIFHDFTYYDNEDSIYAPTFPSLVHMITEHEYNGEPRADYEKEAFESESSKQFFRQISDKGYDTEIYSRDILAGDYMEYIASNVNLQKKEINRKEIRRVLFRLSVYRYVPYLLKERFFVQNPGAFTVHYGIKIPQVYNQHHFENLVNDGMSLSDTTEKRFVIHHYYGMHKSYTNDEFCRETEWDTTTSWQTMQGVWLLVDTYFDKMKELGIYDNATIIVMADHGRYTETKGDDKFNTDSIFFMKKPFETHDEVIRNHENLTHHEFQKIILDSLK